MIPEEKVRSNGGKLRRNMRPDEHKKKKNAAYKKKHGIGKGTEDDSSDKKGSKVKEKGKAAERKGKAESRDGGQNVGRQKQFAVDHRGAAAHGGGDRRDERSSDSGSSDSEVDTQTKKKTPKTFRRREIVSNWQKYELEPAVDDNTARGENYEKLLSMAGEAMSHFRFKDELEWEAPEGLGHGSSEDSFCQFLSVNPTNLAQSLACVPLHQFLGISSDVFPTDQLSSMTEAAREKRLEYKDTWQEGSEHLINPAEEDSMVTPPSSDTSLRSQRQEGIHANALSSALKSKHLNDPASNTQKKTKPRDKTDDMSPKRDASDKSQKRQITNSINSGADGDAVENYKDDSSRKNDESSKDAKNSKPLPEVKGKLNLQDEDLDALLNADSPTAPPSADIKVSLQPAQPTAKSPKKDANLPSNEMSSKASQDAKTDKAKESAELEDWLDSILDN